MRPSLPDILHQSRQIAQMGDFVKPGAVGARRFFTVLFKLMRDKHPPTACLNRWHNIGFHRIADHHRRPCSAVMFAEHGVIGRCRFVRDDGPVIKQIAQAGLRQFALLVQQIAFGDQHQPMCICKRVDGGAYMGQQPYRVGQHILPVLKNLLDDMARNGTLCDVNGGFDHRQHKAFYTKAVLAKIAALGGNKAVMQQRFVRVIR